MRQLQCTLTNFVRYLPTLISICSGLISLRFGFIFIRVSVSQTGLLDLQDDWTCLCSLQPLQIHLYESILSNDKTFIGMGATTLGFVRLLFHILVELRLPGEIRKSVHFSCLMSQVFTEVGAAFCVHISNYVQVNTVFFFGNPPIEVFSQNCDLLILISLFFWLQ